MRGGELHRPAFALGPAVEELPDGDRLLEAALPWIAGLCFIAAILVASWDGARCEAREQAERSAAAGTLAPILASGRAAAAPEGIRSSAKPSATVRARTVDAELGTAGCTRSSHLAEG
ncbi:hypothetical protein C7T35_36285 [Variovorax sp. WS11]|uniref:hypothetical protein n=1 Tax=Variovorax sp. WS11 TaxID=1105204 RepID=UPI000D0D9002|nr:hypothetical protein [Variovorax sp. WS11]NDZ13178.1 hypothetical protein [Variovorax sp. WS11]PSL79707.1 hypothetical protein C7T35_36285 [Variovorax sp. WS11]